MNTQRGVLAPELEELLRVIAADPKRRLFARTSRRLLHGFTSLEAPLRSSATGLSNAERHLLASHRAELAQVLREAYWVRVHGRRSTVLNVHLDFDATLQEANLRQVLSPVERPQVGRASVIKNQVRALQRCEHPKELLIAALQLEESWWARLSLAYEELVRGDELAALVALQQADSLSRSRTERAWTGLMKGLSMAQRGAVVEALQEYLRLIPELPDSVQPRANALLLALHCHEHDLSRSLATEFERESPRDSQAISALVEALLRGPVCASAAGKAAVRSGLSASGAKGLLVGALHHALS